MPLDPDKPGYWTSEFGAVCVGVVADLTTCLISGHWAVQSACALSLGAIVCMYIWSRTKIKEGGL